MLQDSYCKFALPFIETNKQSKSIIMSTSSSPSKENISNLKSLSISFKPDDVKFLLALKSNFSIEECIDNAEGTIRRLSEFVKDGHSDEQLSFTYGKVERF